MKFFFSFGAIKFVLAEGGSACGCGKVKDGGHLNKGTISSQPESVREKVLSEQSTLGLTKTCIPRSEEEGHFESRSGVKERNAIGFSCFTAWPASRGLQWRSPREGSCGVGKQSC